MLEIAIALYVFLGLVTFLAAISDKYVEISGKFTLIFVLLSLVWPVVWLVYLLDS
jgi:Na+-transporting NADH:ubiquinone oxidoreductase subunit NqrE